MSTVSYRPIYSMALRIHLDSAAAPHMVQRIEIVVIVRTSFSAFQHSG